MKFALERHWKKFWIICGLILFAFQSLFGQQPNLHFKHLTAVEGLSQNHVMSIIQDKYGFLWIGTSEGLNRFDGYNFVVYKHDPQDSTSICNDNVGSLLEDRDGNLWVGTEGGLCKYNRATNSFISYVPKEGNPNTVSPGMINEIVEDKRGNLWLAAANGFLDLFDPKTGRVNHISFPAVDRVNKSFIEITAILIDKEENIWSATRSGLSVYDPKQKKFTLFTHQPKNPNSLSNNNIKDIFQDSKGNLWIATAGGGINLFDYGKQNFTSFIHNEKDANSLARNIVMCINEDIEGRLWLGTENGGLDVWDRTNNRFYHYTQNDADNGSINDNSIYTIYKDRLGNMWVGTNSNGLNFYDRLVKSFITYKSIPSDPQSLSHNKVLNVAEEPGKGLWIATDGGGLNFYNPLTGKFSRYEHNPDDSESISSNYVVAVQWDFVENCLWVATWGGGLEKFNPRTGKFKHYRYKKADRNSIVSDHLWCLHQDKDGTLYIGSIGDGFSIYHREEDEFENFSTPQGLKEQNVISIYKDSRGYLWLGSWGNGVDRMDLVKKEFIHFDNSDKYPLHVNSKSVFNITEDRTGVLWFSASSGLNSYDEKTGKFRAYTKNDGLPGSMVNGTLIDSHGNLWLSTNRGVVRFNPVNNGVRTFTVEDGLPTNQYTSRIFKSSTGYMYFGSGEGLLVFHPDSIGTNKIIPPVIITDFQIFNKPVAIGPGAPLKQQIELTREITLSHDQSVFSFEFSALNFSFPEKNQYAYKMEGFDKDWNMSGNKRSATYTNLDPGTYTFRVKASNNDGVWNEKGTFVIIHISPPWWRTWIFKSFVAFLFAGIVAGYYAILKQRNKNLEGLIVKRTKELQGANREIIKKNNELVLRQEEINAQNEELQTVNEGLLKSQEELAVQRDLLAMQNEKLIKAKEIIDEQNKEIIQHNQSLDNEVKERTKELMDYNQQLEQFAFIAAHNLRAPVARILGLGEILKFPTIDEKEEKDIVQKLIVTTEELDQVVKDINTILEVRKNETPILTKIALDTQLSMIKVNLKNEINNTNALIYNDFSKANIIYSVRPYIDSILFNLIHNAIKYRHPHRNPTVNIKTERLEEFVVLTVEDNGLGIDLEKHKKNVFNLYKRFHTHVEGKGMGLYLVKTQVEALGGKIGVESKINEGTKFTVFLKNTDIETQE